MNTADTGIRNTAEHISFLHEVFVASAAVEAAGQLGVLSRLRTGPADATTIARDCAIGERGTRRLLAALTALGLLQADEDGRYALPPVDPLLMRLPADRLAEAIRDDRASFAGDTQDGAESLYPGAVSLLGAWFAPAAEQAAGYLSGDGLHVLDIGAGAAPWSLALALHDPACRVTALDFPAVLPATRQAAAEAGCAGQFTFLGGDVFTTALGRSAYDRVILGNFCHLFDADTNRSLLGHLFSTLRPGGLLAIIDVLPNEQLDGPRWVMLYALGLFLRTQSGGVYPFSSYQDWLREAGYQGVERFSLTTVPSFSLIVARRS